METKKKEFAIKFCEDLGKWLDNKQPVSTGTNICSFCKKRTPFMRFELIGEYGVDWTCLTCGSLFNPTGTLIQKEQTREVRMENLKAAKTLLEDLKELNYPGIKSESDENGDADPGR